MGARARLKGALVNAFLGNHGQAIRRRLQSVRGGSEPVFFHQVDDPYSHLLAQAVHALLDGRGIGGRMAVVPPPDRWANPEPALRAAHALRDAKELSRFFTVEIPRDAVIPDRELVARANAIMACERTMDQQLIAAVTVGHALWSASSARMSEAERTLGAVGTSEAQRKLEANRRELRRRGHYLGAMLLYGGEWYWGIDRLHYLEERLGEAGVTASGPAVVRRRSVDIPPKSRDESVLDFYYSFRSPYSYVATRRTMALAEKHPVDIRIKPVLPMVMRGLPVPRAKRLYIVQDAKREAKRHGVPFGRICDPVGVGVERCLAIFPLAEEQGRAGAFVESAGRGIWSEALDVANDRDLRTIVERAGLPWSSARSRLGSNDWRRLVERNREELFALGLWGVPSYRLGGFATWGQDRIWMLEERLRR